MTNLNNALLKIKKFDEISKSYLKVRNSFFNQATLKESLNLMAEKIFKDFTLNSAESFMFADYKINDSILSELSNSLMNKLTIKGKISLPIELGTEESFSVLIKTDASSRLAAESLLQSIIFNIAYKNDKGNVLFKCADKNKSGLSYGELIGLISENKFFGKKIFKSDSDISDLINELEKTATENVAKLKGINSSVFEYNKRNENKIPISVVSFCDVDDFGYGSSLKQLEKIIENSVNTGISTVFLTEKSDFTVAENSNENTVIIEFVNGQPYIIYGDSKFEIDINSCISREGIKEIEDKMNQVENIDTHFDSFYDLESFNYFSMDSTNKLVIPFAFDENKEIVNLEIGGEAPPHALLSGSTGSGKSVLLHTIIEQTMLNYHPNDVEIWAIDYKAVEFGCYVVNKPPHITVIGQDNSEDFSLSLIDLIQKEYNRRKNLFVQNNTKDLEAYRKLFGKHSMSRILIVIDEFHNLTQAIQNYNGEKNYKTILENLLREMRAMGMSFLFCSQTIAAGLNGLTEAARNQIGCRLSMKHEDISEIRETLSLSLNADFNLEDIKNLHKGQVVYKKAVIERTESGSAFEFKKLNVLFISDETRISIVDNINNRINDDYIKREEIICKSNNRYVVTEKERHPISKFIENSKFTEFELLTLFPGAPTTLEDSFIIELDEEAGNNLLLIGENDDLRESIIFHILLGLLMDNSNKVVISVLNTENADNIRLYSEIKQIQSNRLRINYGFDEVASCLKSLKKLKPSVNGKTVYIWYGLNKLKNLIFLNEQETEERQEAKTASSAEFDPLAAMRNALTQINSSSESKTITKIGEKLNFEDYKTILKQLAEYGPENNRYNISVYNTLKGMKKTGIIKLDDYEYRIGLQMSTDDSYDLFGSSSFITKADDKTAVFYNGSKTPKTIRPYLMPDELIIQKFNENMEEENG